MNKIVTLLFVLLLISLNFSQTNPYKPTTADKRLEAYQQRIKLQKNSLLKNVELRNVGPTVMSGRVVDVDVNPDNPIEFYVAYASGGLWKTTNNGISFTPLFDDQASMTIGDIAVDWKHNEIIWIGTGEDNSSRSSYAGTGIYKSLDSGKTWINTGLAETQRIGKILIHPDNPEVIWVASIGHLYSPNIERGVYKTTDSGKTWKQTLFINENTGAIDFAIDPSNPEILYAAMWHRERRAWNFVESGEGSGIYKSTNGGENWDLISTEESGFPTGEGVGRIGLALFKKNPQIIYTLLDNQDRRKEKEEEEKPVLTNVMLKEMSKEDFLKLEEKIINEYLDEKDFPEKYTANNIMKMVKENKIKPTALADYVNDANADLFDTPVKGAEVYKSTDGGKTWNRTHENYLDDIYYSYGYYFGEIQVDAQNPDKIYIMGVPILKSEDGGKTFTSINQENVHVDHHSLWISPTQSGHLILGNDGGINISFDDGETWFKANTPAVGQFYSVNVDMEKPYNVYGGLQDNGVWFGSSSNKPDYRWYASGKYPFEGIMGGDGMQVAIDTTDNNTVYTGYQFGYYYRVNKTTGDTEPVKPLHELGEHPLRFNWQTPIHLSKHNPDIFYIGSNKLHRSLDKGENYETISGDLTKGGKEGDIPFGTITTIDESPFKFGMIYAGTDDGLIHLTKDGGVTWNRISDNLPQDLWVSRVHASRHNEATIYASLNGYRYDYFESLVYKSNDYGKTWERIGLDIPAEPVNVVNEDPENPDVIYVGTDHALYVSLNGGKTFMGLFKGMPDVPVHDLVIHPRDKEIVVGTHGRSIYIADVSYIQQLTDEMLSKTVNLFPVENKTYSENWGNKGYTWSEPYEPSMKVVYYSGLNSEAKIRIKTEDNYLLNEITIESDYGLNFVDYDLSIDSNLVEDYEELINQNIDSEKEKDKFKETETGKTYLRPGKYKIEVEINGNSEIQSFELKEQKKKRRGENPKIP